MLGYGFGRGRINIAFMGIPDVLDNGVHIVINHMGKVFVQFKVLCFQRVYLQVLFIRIVPLHQCLSACVHHKIK